MNIAGNDIDAIRMYTEDEARFRLAEKIESRGHAAWREYQGAGGVYHLFANAQIGKENIRNRRKHSVEFIKARLVLLDFILANQQYNYLETEQDKVRYFGDHLHLPKKNLPARAYVGTSHTEPTLRYFVDKYPLFFVSNVASSSPVVTFSYVDAGRAGISGFASHPFVLSLVQGIKRIPLCLHREFQLAVHASKQLLFLDCEDAFARCQFCRRLELLPAAPCLGQAGVWNPNQ